MSTERVPRGLLDTSVLIAAESDRTLRKDALPMESAISIVTRAELRAGIHAAEGIAERDRRLATWQASGWFAVLRTRCQC